MAQSMILGFVSSSPTSDSAQTALSLLGILSLHLSLPLPCSPERAHVLSLSPSPSQNKQITIKKKKKRQAVLIFRKVGVHCTKLLKLAFDTLGAQN